MYYMILTSVSKQTTNYNTERPFRKSLCIQRLEETVVEETVVEETGLECDILHTTFEYTKT